MKIHVISDIHLETGPYQLPSTLDCDVIVAAGDIAEGGVKAIEWLKTLGKPVIYVLGNHDYWTDIKDPVDMYEIVDQCRATAAGSNVQVLQNESVIIRSTRFFGTTYWTDFNDFNPAVIDSVRNTMRDYVYINCRSLYIDPDFMKRFWDCLADYCLLTRHDFGQFADEIKERYVDKGRLHPFCTYLLNQNARRTLREEVFKSYKSSEPVEYTKTVVVTHNHPSYKSLQLDGYSDQVLYPNRMRDRFDEGIARKIGAYCSEFKFENFSWDDNKPLVDAWFCGHLHKHYDYLEHGIRIACNPRGYWRAPPSKERSELLSFFGGRPMTDDEFKVALDNHKENPFEGDGWAFDSNFVIDLEAGIQEKLCAEINELVRKLMGLLAEIEQFAESATTKDATIFAALNEVISTRARVFVEVINETQKLIKENTNVEVNFHVRNLDILFVWPGDKRSKLRRIRDLVAAQRKVIKNVKEFRIPILI